MKFSLVTLTLTVLFVAGAHAGAWQSWPDERNNEKREIHVPHPRLRRVYLQKVSKPDVSEQPVVENVKDTAGKVVDKVKKPDTIEEPVVENVKDTPNKVVDKVTKPDTIEQPVVENVKDTAGKVVELKDDSKVKDLTNKPIEPTTTEVPDYNPNVGPNDIDKDLEVEPVVDNKDLKKKPTVEEQRQKRNTYEGLIKNKDTSLETKPSQQAGTINSEIKPTTLPKTVDVTKVEELPKESNEDELENIVAKPLKNNKYEEVKKTVTTVDTNKELNEPKLQLTTPQSDISLSTDKSKETDESNENEAKDSIEIEPSDDNLEKRNRRNTYRDGIKMGMKENAEKPATLLKSKPIEEKAENSEESTTSQSETGLYVDKIEVTSQMPTEGEDNVVKENRQKRNSYGLMNTKEKLNKNTAVPLKLKPEKETYLTGIESTTSALDISLNTDSSEETTNKPSESEIIKEAERKKRNTYGLGKKHEIKDDDEMKEKPATPLKSNPLEETPVTESTASQSGYEIVSEEKEDELTEKPNKNGAEDNKVEEQHRRKRNSYGLMKKDEVTKDNDNELKEKPATPLKSKPLEETPVTESTTSQSGYEIASDEKEEELTEKPNENGAEDNKVEEQHRRKRNSYGLMKKDEVKKDHDNELKEKPETPLKSKPLEETPVIESTTSQSGYEIASDEKEDEVTKISKESETEVHEAEELHRRKRNAYEYLKKSGTQVDTDKKIYEKPTLLTSTPLEVTTPIILDTDLTTSQSKVEEETSSLESVVEATNLDEQL